MDRDPCPHCGEAMETEIWDYPRRWDCGTILDEWKQGYGAIDPVPQRSKACKTIARLKAESGKAREVEG